MIQCKFRLFTKLWTHSLKHTHLLLQNISIKAASRNYYENYLIEKKKTYRLTRCVALELEKHTIKGKCLLYVTATLRKHLKNHSMSSTGVNTEDLNLVQILKPVQVEALTASVVKGRKAECSSGEGAGLEDLKGQKGEEDRLEIKPCSPRLQ